MPLGTEVDLGPGHIVFDGIPAACERGTVAPVFLVHVYCGHGRPSQLLLSSCYHWKSFPWPVHSVQKATPKVFFALDATSRHAIMSSYDVGLSGRGLMTSLKT